ncbi:serine aminopeptidase domain-containing protein [Sphingomicrobium sediminis]|uniref:Lysophospholipase n=1 Tax=Sphingomicrobium sediminis TaxID=2950949 RepID=A0A9X2EMS1_9SPHN|nr:alpha/beta hydrolase [Sphingomicrobium sediminis]MCM8558254.1 lysophospholipase [Sphingomicrobium sediminis]
MRILITALALALSLSTAGIAHAEPDRIAELDVEGRAVEILVWEPGDEAEAVILFGHGHGADPASYELLASYWADAGYLVYAPMAVDSHVHPDRADYDMQSGFIARVQDLQATRGMIDETHADLPVILAGHSFGSFMSLLGGGATTMYVPPLEGPPVAGIIAFSTAGKLPQLMGVGAYADLDEPLLLITGTEDLVPGFVPEWTDHRVSFDSAPAGDKMLVIVNEGTHDLVRFDDESLAETLLPMTRDFIAAHALGSTEASEALAKQQSDDMVTIERR